MKKILISAVALLFLASCDDTKKMSPAIATCPDIEQKIDSIISTLTLEEKVGQMTQITISTLVGEDGTQLTAHGVEMLKKYKIGSVLNSPCATAQNPEVFNALIDSIQKISLSTTGIPCLYGLDHIHGTGYVAGGTLFPQPVNIAATFDTTHAHNMGVVSAYDSRAANVPWSFSPTMDIGRNPEWARLWESFGEDSYVNTAMARAVTHGMQGKDPNNVGVNNIAACLKHYMGYGVPVTGQDRTPASITDNELREKYFAPFKECIRAGALTLMVNSASNNGMPFHCNYEMLTTWLKEDLNWDGMIVTDWADINNLYTRERVASSKKEAVKLAINAGIDLAMVPSEFQFCIDLKELVEEGEVPISRVDDAVRRILRLKYRLGLFDTPNTTKEQYPDFGSEQHAEMSYRAAVESIVLLKNEDNVLPLKKDANILLVGPNAHSMRTLNGGWSYTWQGHGATKDEYTQQYNTIYEALQEKFSNVKYIPCVEYDLNSTNWQYEEVCSAKTLSSAVIAASRADVIVACVGENSYCETPGNLTDLNLSSAQKTLVKTLAATGKPIVLILNQGRPRIINDIEPMCKSVVNALLPSNYGGDAIAALLSGEENFSGRMPFTYPKYTNKFAVYDYKPCENQATMSGEYNYNATMDVQWGFGHGLSYTQYEYSDMKVDKTEFTADDTLTVSVTVKNTGKVDGKESILLFSSDLYASTTPDVRRLRDFTKIALKAGESRTVSFRLPASALAFVNYDGKWALEKGDFHLSIDSLHVPIVCSQTKIWDTPNIY